ncbi:hypothetical protein [Xanthomonas axonopodis]
MLFLITPPTPEQVAQETAAIDAAKRAGIGRYRESVGIRLQRAFAGAMGEIACLISTTTRASGIAWTILKPTAYMQNFLWFKDPIA